MISLKQIIPSKFCLSCDGCCRFNKPDTIWAPYGINPIRYKDNIYLCPHFEFKTRICKIYSDRPLDCVLYPFVLRKPSNSKRVYLALDRNCPFVSQNEDKEFFKAYIKYIKEFLQKNLDIHFLKENPATIADYKDAKVLGLLDV